MNIRTFLFHRVNPESDLIWPSIHPVFFVEIIKYLKTNYEIVPLENTIIGNYKPSGKKQTCSIVFDDGYKDFVEYAMPIIKTQNIPASMYVVIDCVNKNLPPWTYLLNHLFTNTTLTSLEIESAYIPNDLNKNIWRDSFEKIDFIKKLSPILKAIPNPERENIVSQIRLQIDDVQDPENLMMRWEDLRVVKGEGIEIGSHTVSHPMLSLNLFSSDIYHELKESAQVIEKEIGKYPLAISYPFGSCDYRVKKIAKEVGYKMGLSVSSEISPKELDLFEIPRMQLYNESLLKTKLRINGQLQRIKHIFAPNKMHYS